MRNEPEPLDNAPVQDNVPVTARPVEETAAIVDPETCKFVESASILRALYAEVVRLYEAIVPVVASWSSSTPAPVAPVRPFPVKRPAAAT